MLCGLSQSKTLNNDSLHKTGYMPANLYKLVQLIAQRIILDRYYKSYLQMPRRKINLPNCRQPRKSQKLNLQSVSSCFGTCPFSPMP